MAARREACRRRRCSDSPDWPAGGRREAGLGRDETERPARQVHREARAAHLRGEWQPKRSLKLAKGRDCQVTYRELWCAQSKRVIGNASCAAGG